jgi:hypothetical protein
MYGPPVVIKVIFGIQIMHFLRLKPLKEKLNSRSMSQAESAAYLLAALLIYELINYPNDCSDPLPIGWRDWLIWIGGLVTLCLGIFYCYRKNGGSPGDDFLTRFLSLYWVIGWRVIMAGVIILAPVLAVVYLAIPLPETTLDHYVNDGIIIWAFSLNVLIYWRMGIHLHDLSRSNAEYNQTMQHIRPVE